MKKRLTYYSVPSKSYNTATIKKRTYLLGTVLLLLLLALFSPAPTEANEYCFDPSFPVECIDEALDPWCCPPDYPVCGEDMLLCFTDDTSTTATISAETSTTTTVAETTTTTTAPDSETTANLLVALNIKGDGKTAAPESSGTLPGTSPAAYYPPLYSRNGKRIPLVIKDRFLPPPDMSSIKQTKLSLMEDAWSFDWSREQFLELGSEETFWVQDDNDLIWREVLATLQGADDHCNIFIDDTLTLADTTIDLYVTEFEVMYDIIEKSIGVFSDRDSNGKVNILIYDFNDSGSVNTGYMAGYFWSKDYTNDLVAKLQGIRSNEMDIIYIRGDEPSGWETIGEDFYQYNLTTLVHEYQHLVNFGITVWEPDSSGDFSDIWINEMMSMAAETMYFKHELAENPSYTHPGMEGQGYLTDRIMYYNQDPQTSIRNGHGLTYWDSQGDVFANYALAYLFGQYLAIHSDSGEAVFKDILNYMLSNSVFDYRAVVGAAAQNITGLNAWEDLLKSFAIANMLNDSAGLYGYNGNLTLAPHGPLSTTVFIHNSGAVYRSITGSWSVPPDAGPNIRFFEFSAQGPTNTTTTTPGGGNTTTTIGDSNCPPENPIDCDNGYCCPEDLPFCGTGRFRGKCSKAPFPPTACPASFLAGENSAQVELLRALRGKVMKITPLGREYIRDFYNHAPEITFMLMSNTYLRFRAENLLSNLLPDVAALLSGSTVSINPETMEYLAGLLDELSQQSDPELRQFMVTLKEDLANGNFFRELGIKTGK